MSINHAAIISINYTTVCLRWQIGINFKSDNRKHKLRDYYLFLHRSLLCTA